jgi:hypothetical protein
MTGPVFSVFRYMAPSQYLVFLAYEGEHMAFEQPDPATLEAQFLMGHCVPCKDLYAACWSWDVDQVRQQLAIPWDTRWDEHVGDLEVQGLVTFCLYAEPPVGWEDEPREHYGSLFIHAAGVLRLAAIYGRPYVRLHESSALLAHWCLVEAEAVARLRAPYEPGRWEREWPERHWLRRGREEAWRGDTSGETD